MPASQNDTAEFTMRTLMALTVALANKAELDREIETMVLTLAESHGLPSVLPDPAG